MIVKVFALYGFKRSVAGGHVVKVAVDERELNGNTPGAQFVSNPAFRDRECWWAVTLDLDEGQVIKLTTLAGVAGKGRDTDRTTEQWFTPNEDYGSIEIRVPKVGFKRYPLLKGKLQTVSSQTEQEANDAIVEGLLKDVEE